MNNEGSLNIEEIEQRLEDQSPSVKLVYKVLDQHGDMDFGEIREESLLCESTLRYAINELEDEKVLENYCSLEDDKKDIYGLKKVD